MVPKTRTIMLYGKDGKASGPTKAYPQPRVVIQEGELVKDFGDISVWKFEPDPRGTTDVNYYVSFHGKNGQHSGGSACRTEEEAFKRVADTYVMREHSAKVSVIYREYQEKLAALNEEYKGRI